MGEHDGKIEIRQAAGMVQVLCIVVAFSGNVMAWMGRFSF
jgi:hypothetical protein